MLTRSLHVTDKIERYLTVSYEDRTFGDTIILGDVWRQEAELLRIFYDTIILGDRLFIFISLISDRRAIALLMTR
ncbi:hypothetical protein PI95_008225 [Hassallia byssoidea VB512170]|uniref:Uncharacterized protein n=1 Tax=Hassallia byssoidea VB512170 TaxID=1304833 RepID=A0A846H563_9CYAN|nr:hypothetical protein [Hassalia byssoidea]NEU72556.1 hypothetical protein [Hassalia byssoidea VB512170]